MNEMMPFKQADVLEMAVFLLSFQQILNDIIKNK